MTNYQMHQAAQSGQRILSTDGMVGETLPIRFYIAPGFSGFNSPANNRSGYRTPKAALAASLRYERKGQMRDGFGLGGWRR